MATGSKDPQANTNSVAATKWTPSTASAALTEWAKKEIVEADVRFEAFLRFFFGISLSSIAAFFAILKLYEGQTVTIDWLFYSAIAFYITSMLIVVLASLRRKRGFGRNTDLHDEFIEDYNFYRRRMWLWFIAWLVALLLSGLAIYL